MRHTVLEPPLLILLALAIPLGAISGVVNARTRAALENEAQAQALSQADKDGLAETLRLKELHGDEVWPGFAAADIPVVLFNDRFEWLMPGGGPLPVPTAGSGWEAVAGDEFNGLVYYRRVAVAPDIYAVDLGGRLAASLPTLSTTNRDRTARANGGCFGFVRLCLPVAAYGRDWHAAATVHVLFHAFEGLTASERFRLGDEAETGTDGGPCAAGASAYPRADAEFAAFWDREGRLLAAALDETDDKAARDLVREFLEVRRARREMVGNDPALIDYERRAEWLEGLAGYAETRFYEAAFSTVSPYWREDLGELRAHLGAADDEWRFELSGAAQARLLDRFLPGWKNIALGDGVYLEDLLQMASAGF